LHLENGDIITSPEVVDELYKWGVRSVGLMYNHDNQIGGGAGTSSNKDRGLTSLGKKIVGQLMERGMVIDLAHANQKTADDILEQVENYNKTAVTHTALRNPHMSSQINPERLIDKAMLKQIAKKGGVVGFTPTTHFMPSMEAYIDQIKQASDLTGSAKNIAVGSDMGGLNAQDLFKELKEIGQLGIIAEKLSEKANLTDEQIADIMFGNIKRIVDSLNK